MTEPEAFSSPLFRDTPPENLPDELIGLNADADPLDIGPLSRPDLPPAPVDHSGPDPDALTMTADERQAIEEMLKGIGRDGWIAHADAIEALATRLASPHGPIWAARRAGVLIVATAWLQGRLTGRTGVYGPYWRLAAPERTRPALATVNEDGTTTLQIGTPARSAAANATARDRFRRLLKGERYV